MLHVVALLLAASLVPAFDYSIGRIERDVQIARQLSFQSIIDGSAPSPYRYRVLIPYLTAPIVRLAEFWGLSACGLSGRVVFSSIPHRAGSSSDNPLRYPRNQPAEARKQ
jgi:hypothetical protein